MRKRMRENAERATNARHRDLAANWLMLNAQRRVATGADTREVIGRVMADTYFQIDRIRREIANEPMSPDMQRVLDEMMSVKRQTNQNRAWINRFLATRGRGPFMTDADPPSKLIHIRGDGRCLYRSIARGVLGRASSQETRMADQYRAAANEVVCDERKYAVLKAADTDIDPGMWESAEIDAFEIYGGSRAAYCRGMMDPRAWGGTIELHALAHLLRRTFIVYAPEFRRRGNDNKKQYVTGKYFVADFAGTRFRRHAPIHLWLEGHHYQVFETPPRPSDLAAPPDPIIARYLGLAR